MIIMASFVKKLEKGVLHSMDGQRLEADYKKTNAMIMIGSMTDCALVMDCGSKNNAYKADNYASLMDTSMVDVGSLNKNIITVSVSLELIETYINKEDYEFERVYERDDRDGDANNRATHFIATNKGYNRDQ